MQKSKRLPTTSLLLDATAVVAEGNDEKVKEGFQRMQDLKWVNVISAPVHRLQSFAG